MRHETWISKSDFPQYVNAFDLALYSLTNAKKIPKYQLVNPLINESFVQLGRLETKIEKQSFIERIDTAYEIQFEYFMLNSQVLHFHQF